MSTIEQRNEVIAETVTAIHRSLENMFNIPLNYTIFEFADLWLNIPEARRHSSNFDFMRHSHSSLMVCALSITPVGSITFPWPEEAEDVDEVMIDNFYYADRPYTYGEMLSVLYTGARNLYVLLTNPEDKAIREEPFFEYLKEGCELIFAGWAALRPDVVNKMPQVNHVSVIMLIAKVWNEIVKEFQDEDEDDNE